LLFPSESTRQAFDFMVDTGSQITVIDPSLAAELDLKLQGKVGLVSVASFAQASATILDSVEADSKVVENSPAIVQDLRQIQAADPRIWGVLGESFLAHFDLLVDYGHKLLCLDETNAMRDSMRGERIPLIARNILRINCPSSSGPLFRLISPEPELGRFCCNSTPAVTGRPLCRQQGSGSPDTGALCSAAGRQRNQRATGFCCCAPADDADRQPYLHPHLIRDTSERSGEPPRTK
jgi:hypothetical protein